jgi:hypothetical protein
MPAINATRGLITSTLRFIVHAPYASTNDSAYVTRHPDDRHHHHQER